MAKTFSLWLENENGARLDMLCSPFNLKNDFDDSYNNEYDKVNLEQFIYTVESAILTDNTMTFDGYHADFNEWKQVRDFILPQKQRFKLVAIDNQEGFERYVLCRYANHNLTRERDTTNFDSSFTFDKVSNWIYEKVVLSRGSVSDKNDGYPYEYSFPYSVEPVTADYNITEIENEGHEDCPFVLQIPNGGTNIEWEIIQNGQIIGSGKVIKNMGERLFLLDTSDVSQRLEWNGESVREYRDKTRLNFIKFPLGMSRLNVKNVKDNGNYIVTQYVQFRG